jgi:hypothetical protein
MNIYTPAGWLDVPHIEQIANRNNIAFIVIIGKRQIGKTYNVLKHMLDSDKRFILLRGVKTELDMLKRNVNSPFEKIEGYKGRIVFESETEYTASIIRLDESEEGETKTNIGMCAALSSIGRIRGFNGDIYTDVVYDEFIPESHLLKVRHGDDAFNNMYTTIAGNRELEGRPPLRVWLLANSNNLDNDILKALNITEVVERMSLRGEESRIIKDRGIMIILPDSAIITEKRKKTALYRAIGGDSKFSQMAYENAFAYNEYTDVAQKPLAEYKPLITFPHCIVHLHKSDKTLYVTTPLKCQTRYTYTDGEYGRMTFAKDFPEIRAAYMRGRITFQSMAVKNYFLDILDML